MTEAGATSDLSKAFLQRLIQALQFGHRLDDPRNVEVLQRWVSICKGLPDGTLTHVIPGTLRALLRQPDHRDRLIACGITPQLPLQHEAIAPYVISYRRYQKARGLDENDDQARRTIDILRAELRALREQFNDVFDQMAGLEQERARLALENESLQQQLLAERLRGDTAERKLLDTRQRALRMLRLYLFMLKEERTRLSNDPSRERLLTAEIAVETHAATLEALDAQDEAEAQALEILGPVLFGEYFGNAASPLDAALAPSLDARRAMDAPSPLPPMPMAIPVTPLPPAPSVPPPSRPPSQMVRELVRDMADSVSRPSPVVAAPPPPPPPPPRPRPAPKPAQDSTPPSVPPIPSWLAPDLPPPARPSGGDERPPPPLPPLDGPGGAKVHVLRRGIRPVR